MNDISSEIDKHLRTIFVFTCGVDENDIHMTVKTAYENARFPSRIYFGIIDQRTDGKFSNTDSYENVKKVNVDYDASTTSRYNVKSIPTVILTDLQGNEISRKNGARLSEQDIMNWYNG